MKQFLKWLPWGVGLIAYLGVVPLSCAGEMTFPSRLRNITFPSQDGCDGIAAWQGTSTTRATVFGLATGFVTWLIVLSARKWDAIGPIGRSAARTVLLLATLLCLASMGGAMGPAFPLLALLIGLIIRVSHPFTASLWAGLGLLGAVEAGFLLSITFPRGILLFLSLLMVGSGVAFMVTGVMRQVKA